jgi:hypothetical protein
LFLVAAVASIYALALTPKGDGTRDKTGLAKLAFSDEASLKHTSAQKENTLSGQQQFGQFPPCTEAERELAKMLCGKDEDIDLAAANWLIAADMPPFAKETRAEYFAQLDSMTDQVRWEMARIGILAKAKGHNLDEPKTRCNIFCNAIIKLGFAYAEEYRQHDLTPQQQRALHADAEKTTLAGLLRSRRGSCISMPLIYLVLGQRFGFPVHLVAIGQHYFIRWEEPGYRLDIETTSTDKVLVTDDDSTYIDEEGLTRQQLNGSDLRNLTNREVVGQLFFTRSSYWYMADPMSLSRNLMDLSRAGYLASDDPKITGAYHAFFSHYGITSKDTMTTLKQKEMHRL